MRGTPTLDAFRLSPEIRELESAGLAHKAAVADAAKEFKRSPRTVGTAIWRLKVQEKVTLECEAKFEAQFRTQLAERGLSPDDIERVIDYGRQRGVIAKK
jgi:hypothetical protein